MYKAILKNAFTNITGDTVAVKTLKGKIALKDCSIATTHGAGFVHKDLVADLLKECAKMYEFSHPNVLKLVGVCLDGGPVPYIIMPFMANGSLLTHLKEERENLVLDPQSTSAEDAVSISSCCHKCM